MFAWKISPLILIGGVTLALSACGTSAPPTAAPMPEPPPAAAKENIPARATLARDQSPSPDYGAYGYVIFTIRPDAGGGQDRYLAVCHAYQQAMERAEDYRHVNPRNLMVTYWLLQRSVSGDDCAEMVAEYDYARAKEMAARVGRLAAAGPLLVAWDRPYGFADSRCPPLVLDLSTFSDEDLERAFQIWCDRICRQKEAWTDGFSLVIFREEFRNLIQKYGEQIVTVIQ